MYVYKLGTESIVSKALLKSELSTNQMLQLQRRRKPLHKERKFKARRELCLRGSKHLWHRQ